METLLIGVKAAYKTKASLHDVLPHMQQLAQAKYAPAIMFFADGLTDKREEWRIQCLLLLGYEYDLAGHEAALDKIRDMLLDDPEWTLRLRAAQFLSLHSTWPDRGLISSLQSENHVKVRVAAFQSALELLNIPRMRIRDEIAQLLANNFLPSLPDIDRIRQASAR